MQRIEKRAEPPELTRWRIKFRNDPNFGYGLLCGKEAHAAVLRSLLVEQGGICAYTGIAIRDKVGTRTATAHIEHIFPQKHCSPAESVSYDNLLACYPGPNAAAPNFGATFKKDWPSAEERMHFVSPLTQGCEERFKFNKRGEISAARADDQPAKQTILRLGLDSTGLTRLREAAMVPLLKQTNPKQLRSRLNAIERERGTFSEFRFVVRQVLTQRLKQIEGIRKTPK